MKKTQSLQRLLAPKTVAVFGGDSAAEVVRQCQAVGFDGDIWAVNPGRSELAGIPCVASFADLPGVPDASFIAAPPESTLEIVRDLAAQGAPGAICFAAGFAETGAQEGAVLQQRLRDAAGDMPIIGPNCHGYINYLDGVALWPDQHGGKRVERGAALISQSGNIAINLTMQQRQVDFSYVISVGNNSALRLHDYIDALLEDDRVAVIALHVEGIVDVAAFSASAIRALRKGVPIVALKTGRSKRGAEITMSHTASLAGSDELYSALFQRVGVARCDTLTQFLETIKFLSIVGPLPRATLGSMSCSGGDASLVADYADRLQLDVPELSPESVSELEELLGPNVDVSNPLDYHLYIWGDCEKLTQCFYQVLSNRFACTLLILDYPPGDGDEAAKWEISERALIAAIAASGERAVVVSSLPETLPEYVRERLKDAGIAPMQGIEDCLFAIKAAARIGEAQDNLDKTLAVMAPQAVTGSATTLDEPSSKHALSEYGLLVPGNRVCAATETVDAANAIGYPVVLKAVSSDLSHKSELGAVAVNLRDDDAVRVATQGMAANFDQFLVETMVQSVVCELIVGVTRDPTFGLTLTIGAGGILVELVDDSVSLLLPVQRPEIRAAIQTLKVFELIKGHRGKASGDVESTIDSIEAVARYAIAHNDKLLELDVNPLCVLTEGSVAVDAFIRTTI
jgi:acyl-CoA synthetase (NDP forming)